MVISARESSRILARSGISRQQSRRVLLAGLAGPALRTGPVLLYDEARVRDLGDWPAVEHHALLQACPGGVFVVRLAPGEEPDPAWAWEQRAEAWSSQPYLGFPAWLQGCALVGVHGRLACVVTVCGFPVLLADLVSFTAGDDDHVVLGLEKPGPWASLLEHRRLPTGPGPRWLVLGHQPYVGRAQRERDRGEPVGAARATTWTRWA
jgi:hypothetical protein